MILALAGPAGAGKDTLATYLCHAYEGYIRDSFAAPIYHALEAVGFDTAYMEPQRKQEVIPLLEDAEGAKTMRRLAQTLGTEWGRNHVSPDLWIRLLEKRQGLSSVHGRRKSEDGSYERYVNRIANLGRKLIISDLRFRDEARAVRNWNGYNIYIHGRGYDLGAHTHASEGALHLSDIDYMIDNSGTLESSYGQVDHIIELIRAREANDQVC